MKAEILKMLRESEEYVSGQKLCERFQVSRTAVWKVIKQLEKEGYQIEAVRNRGYRILEYPDVLSKEEIESQMQTDCFGKHVVYYEETDSTNTRVKQLAEQGAQQGTLVVADRQSAGKGRRGRGWESPKGENIYMSLLLRPKIEPSKAPMLTLVMAYSVALAIREQEELEVGIKWPNDLVVGTKKICGILTEMNAEIDYINYVVIGVGINVNVKKFPEELSEKATSLFNEQGKEVRRAVLMAKIMQLFEENYERFLKEQNLAFLQEAYNQLLVSRGREVTVLEPGHEYPAHAIGINETGELLVRKEDGKEEAVFAGEVSVRGIYGYV